MCAQLATIHKTQTNEISASIKRVDGQGTTASRDPKESSATKRQGQRKEHVSVWVPKELSIRAGRCARGVTNLNLMRDRHAQDFRLRLLFPLEESKAVKWCSGREWPLFNQSSDQQQCATVVQHVLSHEAHRLC